jgi:hypothetical protein
MIAILGSVLGFFSSSIPSIFKYFQDKADKAHELQLLQMQMEYSKLQGSQNLQEIELQSQVSADTALYKTYQTGVTWVDALNGTVRPVLSYAFFLLYAVVKYMEYTKSGSNFSELWTNNDSIIFSSVISFYFGSRYWDKNANRS